MNAVGDGVSAVVPVFNSEATLPELIQRLDATLGSNYSEWEVILVNDGSTDGSWGVIETLAEQYERLTGIDLERNFGQHNALLAGIRAAGMTVIVTLDDDLQNPPEEIPKLVEKVSSPWRVVYGKPKSKKHGRLRNWMGRLVLGALGRLGGNSAPMVSSFRAFQTDLRRSFDLYNGPDVSIDGLLTWATESFAVVSVDHHERAEGRSQYSILGLVKHALIMITAFSTAPLRIATTLGFVVTIFGVGVLAFVLGRLVIEGGSAPGFPFLASIISIFAGAQLFSLGVLGEYLARMHVRVMGWPSYVERTRVDGSTTSRTARLSGRVALPNPPQILDWDSHFWGFGVATMDPTGIDATSRDELVGWSRENDVKCVFLLADSDDSRTACAAEALGFQYADTRVTMGYLGESSQGVTVVRHEDGVVVRGAIAGEREKVIEMAVGGYPQTRFLFDPRFPANQARKMYGEWIIRGFEAPDRKVIVAEVAGELVGHLVLRESRPDLRTVELIGVADIGRGAGIGWVLLETAKQGIEEGARVEAATQGRNVSALRMYERSGFRVEKSQVWYHLWV